MSTKAEDALINQELIQNILDAPDGVVKMASEISSKVTRTQVREEGFQRAILPFEPITNADLDYDGYSELPCVWFELEPFSPAPRVMPYNSTPNTVGYRAEKYVVLISVVSTEELTKNVNELRTYKTDVRQIVKDNQLRDIHTTEDTVFMTYIDRLADVSNPVALGSAGAEDQTVTMGAAITRDSLKNALRFLTMRNLPIGVNLINQLTAYEFLGFEREEIGGDLAEKLLRKGLKALDQFEIFGIPYVSTIKRDLVPNGFMYQFAPPDYLGHAVMLEDIQVVIKKEYDIIRMRAHEQIGMTIGNTRGVQCCRFSYV